jgi:mono/diheme cytochrome c family protein
LVGAAFLVAALVGYWKLNRRYDNPVATISVVSTPERIARGARLAVMCAGCHAADEEPPLEGNDFLGDDAPPIGTFYAPNLTPTHLSSWTDGEIIRAIREGIHKDGRSLLIMPATAFRHLSDDDAAAIVAFLRTQPPIEPDTPRPRLNVLGAVMANVAPIFEAQAPITQPILAPPAGATPEYGEYLVSYSCAMCHGDDLGGNDTEDIMAPSLIAVALTWSEEEFLELFETGVRPNGVAVDGERMPWKELRGFFLDNDFRAVYGHLRQRFGAPER